MVSLRISSLKGWLWRRDSVKKKREEEGGKKAKDGSVRQESTGKGDEPNRRSSKELQTAASGASSSTSIESLPEGASDWLIGWYEPHGPGFCSDDSFAVLVPCYDLSSPPKHSAPGLSESQLWADVLTKVALETEGQSENTKKLSK